MPNRICTVSKSARNLRASQLGATLIEGLVAITIFSFGILAVVGMMTTHMGTANDARYRTEAAQYAESILSDMRIANQVTVATDFAGPSGSAFLAWKNRITAAGTGLPLAGSSAQPLEITFNGNNVTVTISWRAPTDRSPDAHRYSTVSAL